MPKKILITMTTTNGMNNDCRSYYCSIKFRFLKIDLTSQTTYNCHAAAPHRIDFDWLESNPGQLFNTDINVAERHMMLRNERNKSCEQNCWHAEDAGAVSPRIYQLGTERTHINVNTLPEIIDLTVNSECNLTCSYCCKEFSNSWRRDLIDHGDYKFSKYNDNRFKIVAQDTILNAISQKEMHDSRRYNLLINELKIYAPTLKRLEITGGEPLLDNKIIDVLPTLGLGPNCEVNIYSGLGVGYTRFERLVKMLSTIPNLTLRVSAETIGDMLEFNRYGSSWNEFQQKLKLLDDYSINWVFFCTLSNLTIQGFTNFYNFFPDRKKIISFCYTPTFMAPYVLDDDTKKNLLESLPDSVKNQILQSMQASPSEDQRVALKEFLTQFAHRRNLQLNIFSETFLKWLGLSNVV